MELELKNIGMINEANVKIDGLTVIAGENDTGKSTVGKLLFSIIKASSRYKEDLEENKEQKILSLIEKNYFQLRRRVDFSDKLALRELFYPPYFKRDIDEEQVIAIDYRLKMLKEFNRYTLLDENINLKDIEKNLLDIKNILLEDEDKREAQKRAFKKVLISEFKGKITNQKFLDKKSDIKIYEGENQILDIELLDNTITDFIVFDELYFSDATFIESPLLMQLSEVIDTSKTYFEEVDKSERIVNRRPNVSLHIKDLNEKIKESAYNEDFLDLHLFLSDIDLEKLLDSLSEVIGGNIKYNKKTKDFMYISNGKTYNSLNTATGIKAFGIIEMLIKSGYITQRSLLIFDEPEVHLHPKWQLKYAELIIELVKNNINVLVTSHSPYMIQALIKYARDENIVDKSNFYLTKKVDDCVIINNVNDELNKIFELLAKPMNEVYE